MERLRHGGEAREEDTPAEQERDLRGPAALIKRGVEVRCDERDGVRHWVCGVVGFCSEDQPPEEGASDAVEAVAGERVGEGEGEATEGGPRFELLGVAGCQEGET